MDLNLVKSILQINTNKHDTYIDTMIPLVKEYAASACKTTFVDEQGNENIPGGVKIFIAKSIEHNMNKAGITSRTMGEVSYSYSLDFPPTVLQYLKPYENRKLKCY